MVIPYSSLHAIENQNILEHLMLGLRWIFGVANHIVDCVTLKI